MTAASKVLNPGSIGYGQFPHDGFQLFRSVLNVDEADDLGAELSERLEKHQVSEKNKIGGLRNLPRDFQKIALLSVSPKIVSLLKSVTELELFPVRAIFFDKTSEANWLVPWHQDLAIAVKKRVETPGFTGWSVKEGVLHVHPPLEILESMVALRLHLDDCYLDNGPLQVIPASHKLGKMKSAEISECSKQTPYVCEATKGDALLIHPLLLHSSSASSHVAHRRVLHIEYASEELPNGLEWFER